MSYMKDPKGNISGIPKWGSISHAGIYIGHSPFNSVSVSIVINPSTSHVSPQFHVVFDDEFTTVRFMREGTIPSNWTYLVKCRSQSVVSDDIELKYD